jgi:hypothetical protein
MVGLVVFLKLRDKDPAMAMAVACAVVVAILGVGIYLFFPLPGARRILGAFPELDSNWAGARTPDLSSLQSRVLE